MAIEVDGGGDVEGRLLAAFDLEGGDVGAAELREEVGCGQILHGHEVGVAAAALAVADVEASPADVGAGAAVSGGATEGGGEAAEAAVGVAEGAVDEDLGLDAGQVGDACDFGDGEFACEDDARESETPCGLGAMGVMDGELGAGVELEVGEVFADELEDAPVLDDEGVDVEFAEFLEEFEEARLFVLAEEGVDGDVDFSRASGVVVCQSEEGTEFLGGEVAGVGSCGEVLESEVDGVGAVLEGGDGGFEGACRCE